MNFYMMWLTKVFKLNIKPLTDFLEILSPIVAYNSTLEELKALDLNQELIDRLISQEIKDKAKYEFEFCQKENIEIIDFLSENYPCNLINIPTPPPIIYCKGKLLPRDEVSISVVGSRKYTEYGRTCTKKFVSELAKCGITIVSGMAYGIDAFAHEFALKEKGRTIAVLGTGVDVIYPIENKKLYYEIIENGAVISEFPIHTQANPKNFPIRNRIVAGLSLGTLVIEANKKSGTMITARLAAEAGRNIYAVPGEIFNISSLGTNLLIKDGAKIATCSQDIIEDIYTETIQKLPKPEQLSLFNAPSLTDKEKMVYDKLSLTPVSIENLIENVDLPVQEINVTLTMLELSGYIKVLPGNQYVLLT